MRLSVTALSYDGVLSIALLAGQTITDLPPTAAGRQRCHRLAVRGE